MTFVLLAIVAAAQTFLQMGFIGVGNSGEYVCYIMAILVPITLAALLLGKWRGMGMGLFSGSVLLLHSKFQPLDLYERYLVTPLNSVVIFTFLGFLIGALFALASRSRSKGWIRMVQMASTTIVSAVAASVFFLTNLVTDTIFQMTANAIEAGLDTQSLAVPRDMVRALVTVSNIGPQIAFDFLLMFVAVIVALVLFDAYVRMRNRLSLRVIFQSRLFVVMVVAFLVVSSVAFATITIQCEQAASDSIDNELQYLAKQLQRNDAYAEAIRELDATDGVKSSDLDSRLKKLGDDILDGYTLEEDGTVTVFRNGVVESSDNPAYPAGKSVEEVMGEMGLKQLENLASTRTTAQSIYDVKMYDANKQLESGWTATTEIGYMRVVKVGDRYVMMARPSKMVFSSRRTTMFWTLALTLVLLLVVYIVASHLLRVVVIRDIDKTNDALGKISDGDLNTRVHINDSVEFASLSEGINSTVDALEGWIGEAERRMERDLATAKAIQESALPRTFPPFPEIEAFDIYASMNAAKEVGGDFYDFFLVDDRTLGFLIADVSGKGIPGALFMMTAKTQIENYMSAGMDLDEAILSANRRLCATNDAGMFVTVWAATLDWETGLLTYVNAGHNPPLLRHEGTWEWLNKKGGLFLGTFERAKYRSATLTLEPGDELMLYTDGVNEAFNVAEEEYGNDRLEAFLTAHAELHPKELVSALRADVATWAEGAEQSDDITMLCLEYGVAPEVTGTITLTATLDNVGEADRLVCTELDARLCPANVKHKIQVALEELFVNVCNYAYAERDEPGSVRVSYVYRADPNTMTVELVDQGAPFDPLLREDPTRPSSIQETKVGGLGIFIVRQTMDDFSYLRDGDDNVVVFSKKW